MAVDTSGTIDEVLEQVGDDPVLAREALEAERGDKNRSTLISKLESLADEPPVEEESSEGLGVSPSVPSAPSSAGSSDDDVVYVARRRLKTPNRTYEAGDVVPEANDWKRVEGYVRVGYLEVQQ